MPPSSAPSGPTLSKFMRKNTNRQSTLALEEQFAADGRDLSDPTQPGYDPDLDPELRLRVTRTAAESLYSMDVEEDRRRIRRQSQMKLSNADPLKPRKSIFGRKRKNTVSSKGGDRPTSPTPSGFLGNLFGGAHSGKESAAPSVPVMGQNEELHRKMRELNAAKEAEESAQRQARQEAKKEKAFSKNQLGQREKGKERRVVAVNDVVGLSGVGANGDGYERNKVRTSKYTIVTFLPKNLMDQFRRVANIYFLLMVILQIFPVFGAAAPEVAMLPLVAILALTGAKDAIEDYRRQKLDDAVNNSAVTRLGDWRNVNHPLVIPKWYQWWVVDESSGGGLGTIKVSKGVKKLRQREGEFDSGFLYEDPLAEEQISAGPTDGPPGTAYSAAMNPTGSSYTLPGSSYPPTQSSGSLGTGQSGRTRSTTNQSTVSIAQQTGRARSGTTNSTRPSLARVRTEGNRDTGVVDYNLPINGLAKWERTLWKKLEVGDIVLLKENDQIPADLVILSSSDPDGLCFVETKNLDGETNLKQRRCVRSTMGIGDEEDVERSHFWVDSEPPHSNLYSYNGTLRYRKGKGRVDESGGMMPEGEIKEEGLTINEILLRGCSLRNTRWVIGLVLFTGADTKIMLNQGETPSKRSKIEIETNFNVIVNFVLLMLLCIICGLADGYYVSMDNRSANYYEQGAIMTGTFVTDALVTVGACLILFQNIVPISLVITVELVKTIQAYFIYQDIEMYYEPLDLPCVPKTWNISDDLGQIEYIFSDKTGTLTQNVMDFQKCAINGIPYGEGITEAMLGAAKREGRDTSAFDPTQSKAQLATFKSDMLSVLNSSFKNRYLQPEKLTMISPQMASDMTSRTDQAARLARFWKALAICHTVLADVSPDDPFKIEYKAESPDEAALVAAARDVGFPFISRSNTEIKIEALGQPEKYTPLRVLEFNSTRKRMSTVVRCPDGKVLLICKGADSVIYQRLKVDHDKDVIASTSKCLEDFANDGLRTLCISARFLSEDEFQRWAKAYDSACASVEDRDDAIEHAAEMIERDLEILGCTALEDKLQEGVPDAIEQLHKAGLKLWILTGDKLQTAIEIGFSCNLLSKDMEIMILSAESETGARTQIEKGLDKINRHKNGTFSEKSSNFAGFAVVIDGETLRYALDDNLKPMFLELTTQCDTVVCCRVSPSQKALTVKLVKDGKNAMTLAIGDGANDVAMIQEAHIGVGIAGLEGAQASMCADYAVGQFRYLTRLLIVHGRWCYIRIADMHANFFYKNINYTLSLFIFQIWCHFNSTYLFDYTLLMLFNLLFTSLPVGILGIFDQDVNAATALAVPQLYRRGIKGLEYNRPIFFGYMLEGLYHAIVCFFVPYFVYDMAATHSVTGRDFSILEFGNTVAACCVTSCNLFVGMHIRYWTWLVFAVIIGSTLSFHAWIIIYSQFPDFRFGSGIIYLYPTTSFWASLVISQVVALGPKYLYKYLQSTYFPTDNDLVREMEVSGTANKLAQYKNDPEAQQKLGISAITPLQATEDHSPLTTTFHPDQQPLPQIVTPAYDRQPSTPKIMVEGATPRGSVASRLEDRQSMPMYDYYSSREADGDYEPPRRHVQDYSETSEDAFDLNRNKDQRREGSDVSWNTAPGHDLSEASWGTAPEYERAPSPGGIGYAS